MKVIVYSSDRCPFCLKVKDFLKEHNIDFEEIDVSQNMEKAVLIAGDLDFEPVVESLIRFGTYVEVKYERNSAAKNLHLAADFGQEINLLTFYNWTEKEFIKFHPLPKGSYGSAPPPDTQILQKGKFLSEIIELRRNDNQFFLYVKRYKGKDHFLLKFEIKDRLLRYFEAVFGVISWE